MCQILHGERISGYAMNAHLVPTAPQVVRFHGETAGTARAAASSWLGDFSLHGPLEIRAIRTAANEDAFTAAVFYSEMQPLAASNQPDPRR